MPDSRGPYPARHAAASRRPAVCFAGRSGQQRLPIFPTASAGKPLAALGVVGPLVRANGAMRCLSDFHRVPQTPRWTDTGARMAREPGSSRVPSSSPCHRPRRYISNMPNMAVGPTPVNAATQALAGNPYLAVASCSKVLNCPFPTHHLTHPAPEPSKTAPCSPPCSSLCPCPSAHEGPRRRPQGLGDGGSFAAGTPGGRLT